MESYYPRHVWQRAAQQTDAEKPDATFEDVLLRNERLQAEVAALRAELDRAYEVVRTSAEHARDELAAARMTKAAVQEERDTLRDEVARFAHLVLRLADDSGATGLALYDELAAEASRIRGT
jgi:uncharacterized protein (DUF3084 family)